jgi:uncharacterized protein YjbJ (UPF0337 family)
METLTSDFSSIRKHAIEISTGCQELKRKFKQKYTNITDDDLLCKEGKEAMLGKLQQKLGKSREELRQMILML